MKNFLNVFVIFIEVVSKFYLFKKKQYEIFISSFSRTTFRFLPTIAEQVVDLHLLYNTVLSHGGWDKVNDRQLWPIIANHFSIDTSCLNGTQALKNIYIR
jgi:hypothetical protein